MRRQRSNQEGVMLLEALIGLLIFSLGILALVAMQSVSVSNISNAKYRVDAAFLADEILNRIWLDRGNNLNNVMNYAFPGGGSPVTGEWVNKVRDPVIGLPGSTTFGPTIAIVMIGGPAGAPTTAMVTVTLNWRAPDAVTTSTFTSVGYISDPSSP